MKVGNDPLMQWPETGPSQKEHIFRRIIHKTTTNIKDLHKTTKNYITDIWSWNRMAQNKLRATCCGGAWGHHQYVTTSCGVNCKIVILLPLQLLWTRLHECWPWIYPQFNKSQALFELFLTKMWTEKSMVPFFYKYKFVLVN